MNFAYLDARALIESVLQEPHPEPIEPIEVELDERWQNFEKILGTFKHEYAVVRRDLVSTTAELNDTKRDVGIVKPVVENVRDPDLKDLLENVLDKYESEKGTAALTQQCRELLGKANGMARILKDTACERYAKFTCFVCMDRLVDLFIDPCGHVMCDACFRNTRDRVKCPGCRGSVHGVKRIFPL
jgi:hypothetical protein